jgi:hypothetical protein
MASTLTPPPGSDVLFAALPGPTRKRAVRPYCFRLTYRNPDPRAEGCALAWEVYGGRLTYQVALEREACGRLRWHCTCADAVYRGEEVEGHCCKHVRGLLTHGRRDATPNGRSDAPGRNESR